MKVFYGILLVIMVGTGIDTEDESIIRLPRLKNAELEDITIPATVIAPLSFNSATGKFEFQKSNITLETANLEKMMVQLYDATNQLLTEQKITNLYLREILGGRTHFTERDIEDR